MKNLVKGVLLCIGALAVCCLCTHTVKAAEHEAELSKLYKETAEATGLTEKQIKYIHSLNHYEYVATNMLGGINDGTTVNEVFHIEGLSIEKVLENTNVKAPETIQRPNALYPADSAYTVAMTVKDLMNQESDKMRDNRYFAALKQEVKDDIAFQRVMLQLQGANTELTDNYYETYRDLVACRNGRSFITMQTGKPEMDSWALDVLDKHGASTEDKCMISKMIGIDGSISEIADMESVTERYIIPYTAGKKTRLNMLTAGFSVIGKVRYVWGGGHGLTGTIKGISPAWQKFCDTYGSNTGCLKPSGSTCPIHGSSDGVCSDTLVSSFEEYLQLRSELLGEDLANSDKYKKLYEGVELKSDIEAHHFDGLDCSGFASWCYNQADNDRKYDSVAREFVKSCGMKSLGFGDKLEPGDVFAWRKHIVIIVGKVSENSKAYVHIESTPDMVRCGVSYWSGASQADIAEAEELAKETNRLFGGNICGDYAVRKFCMNTVGMVYEDDDDEEEEGDEPEGEGATPTPEPESTTPTPEPTTPTPEPEPTTPEPEPESTEPTAEPVTPSPEPQPATPTVNPSPSPSPSPTVVPEKTEEEKQKELEEEKKRLEEEEKKRLEEEEHYCYTEELEKQDKKALDEEDEEELDEEGKPKKKNKNRVKVQTATFGRSSIFSADEEMNGKLVKDMTAREIIEYIEGVIGEEFLSGRSITEEIE